MGFTHEFIYQLIIFGITILGFYLNAAGKIKDQENRLTMIEATLSYISKQVESNISRLNDHEKQQQTMVALVQQVKNLSDDMSELKADMKLLLKSGGN